MKRLSELTPPALAGVVKERTATEAIAAIARCAVGGADMVDLHLSCLDSCDPDALRSIISASPLPVLALHYNATYQSTDLGHTEEERVALLLRAVEAGAAGMDMQGYTYHLPSKSAFCAEDKYSFTRGNPREVVTDDAIIEKQCALIEQVHAMGAEVLLSCHPGIPMRAETVVELALFLEKRRPDIIKIVTVAEGEEDLSEALRAMLLLRREVATPVSYHAAGEAGRPSRLLCPILGGQIAFCTEQKTEASLAEQLDLRSARAAVNAMRNLWG